MEPTPAQRAAIARWLALVCALIVGMVVVGGITRLTGSGLSITEWKPIMGAIPPLSEPEWREAFARYREIPQYRVLNAGMDLAGFKAIFFWEYLHRLLGRLIGLVYFVPAVIFMARGWAVGALRRQLVLGFVLGGLQGALGWFMVSSGLADRVYVSHYRLAAHLLLALGLLVYLYWLRLQLLGPVDGAAPEPRARRWTEVALVLLALQIFYGALVAGLKAGFGYNTFPTMDGDWIPRGFRQVEPAWLNLFDSHAGVQFVHRWLGFALLALLLGLALRFRRAALTRAAGVAVLQFALGVATIRFVVPVPLAALHQLGACVLLLVLVHARFALRATP